MEPRSQQRMTKAPGPGLSRPPSPARAAGLKMVSSPAPSARPGGARTAETLGAPSHSDLASSCCPRRAGPAELPRPALIMLRPVLFAAGFLCLVLGVIGTLVPLLPTTPFLLLAAWCFARSSEKWSRWLLEHKTIGPVLSHWSERGAIRLRVKWIATVMLAVLLGHQLAFAEHSFWVDVAVGCTGAGVIPFLWTRPSGPTPAS